MRCLLAKFRKQWFENFTYILISAVGTDSWIIYLHRPLQLLLSPIIIHLVQKKCQRVCQETESGCQPVLTGLITAYQGSYDSDDYDDDDDDDAGDENDKPRKFEQAVTFLIANFVIT